MRILSVTLALCVAGCTGNISPYEANVADGGVPITSSSSDSDGHDDVVPTVGPTRDENPSATDPGSAAPAAGSASATPVQPGTAPSAQAAAQPSATATRPVTPPTAVNVSAPVPPLVPAPVPSPVPTSAAQTGTWKGMRVGTNFWFLAEGCGEDAWKPGVDFATTDDPWNPAFIADLEEARYAVLRFMDFNGTNNSPIREWSERTLQRSSENKEAAWPGGRGIAYEWMFDLCNRVRAHCWISVPHLAIESYERDPQQNYFTELAKLAKQRLHPDLHLYLEYSNETWNYGLDQAHYSLERGLALGLDADKYTNGTKFHVYASVRMFDAFQRVYGGDVGRVKWVLSGTLHGAWSTARQVEALKDPRIHPFGTMPAYYAIANYVANDEELDGADPNIAERYRAALQRTLISARDATREIAGTGMKLISYEGGHHLTKNADLFSRNPLVYQLYAEWLEQMRESFELTMNYAHSGHWQSNGAWGARERTGQPLAESHKARAVVDYIRRYRD